MDSRFPSEHRLYGRGDWKLDKARNLVTERQKGEGQRHLFLEAAAVERVFAR